MIADRTRTAADELAGIEQWLQTLPADDERSEIIAPVGLVPWPIRRAATALPDAS